MSEQKDLCPECNGTGQSGIKVMGYHTDCAYCKGTGRRKRLDRPDREKINS